MLAAGTRLELAQGDFVKVENGQARYGDSTKGGGLLEKTQQVAEWR